MPCEVGEGVPDGVPGVSWDGPREGGGVMTDQARCQRRWGAFNSGWLSLHQELWKVAQLKMKWGVVLKIQVERGQGCHGRRHQNCHGHSALVVVFWDDLIDVAQCVFCAGCVSLWSPRSCLGRSGAICSQEQSQGPL